MVVLVGMATVAAVVVTVILLCEIVVALVGDNTSVTMVMALCMWLSNTYN